MKGRLPKVIAHRGGKKWAPENTMAAFRKSLELGADGIELDIHRCSTGELVVIHDDDVKRTTNGVGLVKDISLAELKRLSAGLWFGESFRDERIPLLSEVLDLVGGKLMLNIEIKNTPIDYPGIEDDLLRLLEGFAHKDSIVVSSFDHGVIARIKAKTRKYRLALLADALFFGLADYAARVGTTLWHPCFGSLRADAVDEAHAAGLEVNAWTVNDARDWSACVALGLDGIVTDDPEGLKSFLATIKS